MSAQQPLKTINNIDGDEVKHGQSGFWDTALDTGITLLKQTPANSIVTAGQIGTDLINQGAHKLVEPLIHEMQENQKAILNALAQQQKDLQALQTLLTQEQVVFTCCGLSIVQRPIRSSN